MRGGLLFFSPDKSLTLVSFRYCGFYPTITFPLLPQKMEMSCVCVCVCMFVFYVFVCLCVRATTLIGCYVSHDVPPK